ncbi:hypothetical protein [Blastopirellula marina]|uniref:Uncharacterized protein n=1 Tax=Blastopirellula marina TaxID=124 RepID=A0A2S8FHG1_9BACT|nr:hypothetical protein [Blastopirellula marina]PQO31582.1 hypothetical protein C5Y98_19385 [Blastopirellula marina]PTL42889.1 hypothetical protein C5Y97_19395 [Blastopirellula marina]
MDARRIAAVLLVATLVVVSGCATWQTTEEASPPELPKRPISEDTVMLEMARLSLTSAEELAFQNVWQEVDEQSIPLDKRRELATNGFRVGIIDFHMPVQIRDMMKGRQGSKGLNGEEMVQVDGEERAAINHRQFARGKRSEYVMVPLQPEVSLLEKIDGVIRGGTYEDAECKFVMKAFPQNDGRVKIAITPEIHYGQARQRIEPGEGMFRIETRREIRVLDQVGFSATLEPGQTLLISGTDEPRGIGQVYFQRESGGSLRRQVLLIRVAGTQFDDLFQTPSHVKENLPLNDDSTDGLLPSHFDEPTGD